MLAPAVLRVMIPQSNLREIYYDLRHPASLGSIDALSAAAGIGKKEAKKFLKAQPTYTLHRDARVTRYKTRKYRVSNIDSQWQADLMDMQVIAKYNNGYRYALTVIDILSRYGWVRLLKSKQGAEVAEAFRSIFNEGRIPARMQCDMEQNFLIVQ